MSGNYTNMGNGGPPVPLPISSGMQSLDSGLANVIANRKRGISEPSVDGLFNLENSSAAKLQRKINTPTSGERIGVRGSPLDGMRTGLRRNPFVAPTVPSPERTVNAKQTHTRTVQRAPPGSFILDTVSKGTFGWLYRGTYANVSSPNDPASVFARHMHAVINIPMDSARYDADLSVIYSGAILNYFFVQAQLRMFAENYEAFLELGASDVMRCWTFDGLVLAEDMLTGAESGTSSGFAKRGRWLGGDGVKVVTMLHAGEDLCINVFGDQVAHGAAVGFYVKKFNINKTGLTFNLDSKGVNPLLTMVNSDLASLLSQERVDSGSTANMKRAFPGGNTGSKIFKPWLIAMYANIDGDILPLEYHRFTDEEGVVRYDTYQCHIGTVLIAPEGHVSKVLPADTILIPHEQDANSDWLVDLDPEEINVPTAATPQRPGIANDAAYNNEKALIKIHLNPRGFNPLN